MKYAQVDWKKIELFYDLKKKKSLGKIRKEELLKKQIEKVKYIKY